MKKILLLAVLVLTVFSVTAQENIDTKEKNTTKNFNEVKLNGLFLVLGALELTYERTLNEESAVGMSFFFANR